MNRKQMIFIFIFLSLLVVLTLIWANPRWWKTEKSQGNHPVVIASSTTNNNQLTEKAGSTPTDDISLSTVPARETPDLKLPDNVVVDPESGQYVIFNELTILASGEDIEMIVTELKGEIVLHVEETDTYQARFPGKDLSGLKKIRMTLEARGLTVYYSVVLIP